MGNSNHNQAANTRYSLDDHKRVFEWIVQYKKSNQGNTPTIRQIKEGNNIGSTSTTNRILERLEDLGFIKRPKPTHINIEGAIFMYALKNEVDERWTQLIGEVE